MILHVGVANKIATFQKRDGCIVCGNSDYQIQFTFDSEWNAHTGKTARFIWNGQFVDVDFTGDTCNVPIIQNTYEVKVGVYAGDLRTTTSAVISCYTSILCEGATPSVENDRNYANEAKEAADRAEESAKKAELYGGTTSEEAAERAEASALEAQKSVDEVRSLVVENSEATAQLAAQTAAQTAAQAATAKADEVIAQRVAELGVVQTTGNSETAVMSQKAVTDVFDTIRRDVVVDVEPYLIKNFWISYGSTTGQSVTWANTIEVPCKAGEIYKLNMNGTQIYDGEPCFIRNADKMGMQIVMLNYDSVPDGDKVFTIPEGGASIVITFSSTKTTIPSLRRCELPTEEVVGNEIAKAIAEANKVDVAIDVSGFTKYNCYPTYGGSRTAVTWSNAIEVPCNAGETYKINMNGAHIPDGTPCFVCDVDKKGIQIVILDYASVPDGDTEFTVAENGAYIVITYGSGKTSVPLLYKCGVTKEEVVAMDIENALNPTCEGYGLPVLYFSGDTSAMTKDNKVTLAYKYDTRVGTCTMKWQGTSSLEYPKKNYTVVFDYAFELKDGWGLQSKYCLKADYIDFSHIRNVCSAKLWGSIVKSRTTPNAALNALPNGGAIDGFPVCVVINGKYVGLYSLCIPKDAWMLGMGSGSQEAIVSAEGGNYSANHFWSTNDTFDGAFDIEYVTNEDDSAWVETSLNRLIQACIDSDGTDLDTTIAQYLDWDSAIDYFIYCVAVGHIDGIHKNHLLCTYDGVKWFFTAYDLDSVFGNYVNGKQVFSANAYAASYVADAHRLFWLIYRFKLNEVKARLATLIGDDGALNDETLISLFSNYSATIPKALLDEDCKIWKSIPGTTYNNLGQIIDWYRRRYVYLKQWFG